MEGNSRVRRGATLKVDRSGKAVNCTLPRRWQKPTTTPEYQNTRQNKKKKKYLVFLLGDLGDLGNLLAGGGSKDLERVAGTEPLAVPAAGKRAAVGRDEIQRSQNVGHRGRRGGLLVLGPLRSRSRPVLIVRRSLLGCRVCHFLGSVASCGCV